MRSYFDGSEGVDDSGHKWLTLAGYMASDALWAGFQSKWETMLRSRYPIPPWLHMYELMNHDDPFERINGWTDEKIADLVTGNGGALDTLQKLDKKAFRSFVCSVDTTARESLLTDGREIPDAAIMCANTCFRAVFDWYVDSPNRLESAYVFYDQDESFFESIRREWKRRNDPRQLIVAGDIWGLIANMHDANMRVTPPIQAADLMAWAYSREFSQRDRAWRHLAHIMRSIIPSNCYRIDEHYMRKRFPRPARDG